MNSYQSNCCLDYETGAGKLSSVLLAFGGQAAGIDGVAFTCVPAGSGVRIGADRNEMASWTAAKTGIDRSLC